MFLLSMTDFHKLFMVKINKMIKKKTGGIFLVVYVIMVALCIQIARKLCFVYSETRPQGDDGTYK